MQRWFPRSITALALVALVSLSSACGTNDSPDADPVSAAATAAPAAAPTPTSQPSTPTSAPTATPEPTATPAPTATPLPTATSEPATPVPTATPEPTAAEQPATPAEPTATAGPNTAAGVDGGAVFQANCARCHGADGTGAQAKAIVGIGGFFVDDASPLVDLVTNGGQRMPSFGDKLSPEEIDAVVQYVVTTFP